MSVGAARRRASVPMFSAWSPHVLGFAAGSQSDPGRSRSPSRRSSGSVVPGTAPGPDLSDKPWTTGNQGADRWLLEQQCDAEVLRRFSDMPKNKRKSIILRCMEKKPDNLDAWLFACARNFAEQDLEARVTGIASVHRSAPNTPVPVYNVPVSPTTRPASSELSRFAGHPVSVVADGGHAGGGGSDVVPNLSTELFSFWPQDKSALIRVVAASLSGGCLADFLSLPVHDQTSLAFTVMVAAPENPSARASLVDSWISRLSALRNTSPPPTLPTHALTSAPAASCKVQFILAGLPTCMTAVVTASVKLILPKLHPQVKWEFCTLVYLHEEAPDGVSVTETFAQVGLPIREDITSLRKLVGQMGSDTLSEWSSGNVKFVLVSCLSHDAGLDGSNPLQPHHLHSASNRWLWGMVSASQALRSKVGDTNVADVLICPARHSDDFAQEARSLWGPSATGMERLDDEAMAGSPKPAFFCTPGGLSIVPVCENDARSVLAIDNWTGPPLPVLQQVQASLPGFLPAHLATLATTVLFRERELTPQQTAAFKSLRMRHSSGGERLCSRQFWCRWYGYNHTPVQKVLLDHEACVGMVIPTTGTAAPPGLPPSATSPCGQDRFCLGCEKHLAVLSKGFQTYTVTDLLLSLLTKASRTWTGQEAGNGEGWSRSSACSREHMCGDDCPFLRQ